MSLVAYSSSEDEDEDASSCLGSHASKKRKLSLADGTNAKTELPPLPASFLDQYSSTVRTSAQDDPSLHAGRKRVTPHVQGQWPTHVYLEWHPGREEAGLLSELVTAAQNSGRGDGNSKANPKENYSSKSQSQRSSLPKLVPQHQVHSLLQNDLGVSLPLHISLSRPLTLKTAQKDAFLHQLRQQVAQNRNIKAFEITPKDLAWHPNETGTRWFLVLRLESTPGSPPRKGMEVLRSLLAAGNDVAREFGQPVLYPAEPKTNVAATKSGAEKTEDDYHFHISIAWSLQPPGSMKKDIGDMANSISQSPLAISNNHGDDEVGVPYELLARLSELSIKLSEIKVRIGQDVYRIPLKAWRQPSSLVN